MLSSSRLIEPPIIDLLRSFALLSMRFGQALIALLNLIQMRRYAHRHSVVAAPCNSAQNSHKQHIIKWLARSPCDYLSRDWFCIFCHCCASCCFQLFGEIFEPQQSEIQRLVFHRFHYRRLCLRRQKLIDHIATNAGRWDERSNCKTGQHFPEPRP